jgi:hypothetical protein
MKRLFAIMAVVILTASLFAQSPQKISYQAVIRNSTDQLVTNHEVGMRVSILQGSPTGTEVYKEMYNPNPQTNANGLVTLEIGGGIPLTGTFTGIDWSAGSYYIKTETDPTGGTSYTITGTSQLLSVPYALYSKNAETVKTNANLTGMVTSVGNVTTIVNNANLTGQVTSVGNLTTVTNSAVINKVLTGYASGAGTVTAADNILTAIQKLDGNNPTHYIGESYGGGIVFYVYDNGRHGLIAATANQSPSMRWYAGTYTNTMAYADGVGAGKANTAIIIANQGLGDEATYAARICNEYSVTVGGVTYGDWYLPSEFELNLLYLQKTVVGGFANSSYWSSTEVNNYAAWFQSFANGSQYGYGSKYYTFYVRAVRAF